MEAGAVGGLEVVVGAACEACGALVSVLQETATAATADAVIPYKRVRFLVGFITVIGVFSWSKAVQGRLWLLRTEANAIACSFLTTSSPLRLGQPM